MITTIVLGSGCFPQERQSRRIKPVLKRRSHGTMVPRFARDIGESELKIRNLAEYGRAACACGRGNIGWLMAPCLVRQQGKGKRFLGLAGNAKVIGVAKPQSELAGFYFQHPHESAIAGAAPGDNVIAE